MCIIIKFIIKVKLGLLFFFFFNSLLWLIWGEMNELYLFVCLNVFMFFCVVFFWFNFIGVMFFVYKLC